jgi:hypothetical protein
MMTDQTTQGPFMSKSIPAPVVDSGCDPEEAAENILGQHGERDIPTPLLDIARRLDVVVESGDIGGLTARYTPAHGKSPARVVFASGLNEIRERFAIAHALAHHVLDHGPMEDTQAAYGRSNPDHRHHAANTFALSLLLPESEIRRTIEHRIASSAEGIARLFGVSEPALITQLTRLGFINRKL